MEEELEELKTTISRLQNLLRVANERINRLEEKVAPLHADRLKKENLTIEFDGQGEKSPLGKSLGDIYREKYDNSNTTNYPLRPLGGQGKMPEQ